MNYIEELRKDKYCLHDSIVAKAEFVNHKLELTFSDGFWETNERGKMVKQRNGCKIKVNFLIAEDEELNLSFYKETSKKRKALKISEFFTLVNKYGFRIHREFRCGFSQQLVLEGNANNGKYILVTQEIVSIEYEFDVD